MQCHGRSNDKASCHQKKLNKAIAYILADRDDVDRIGHAKKKSIIMNFI